MIKIEQVPDRIVKPVFNPHRPEKLAACDKGNFSAQCASLDGSELKSIADSVLNPEIVATAPEVKWINLLQIDSLIPPFLAILLKHCGKDRDTFKNITRTILQEQLNQGILTNKGHHFLLQTLNSEKFEKVYKYLYAAAIHHRTKSSEPTTDVVAELNGKWFFLIDGSIDQLRLRYVRSKVEAWLKDVQLKHPEANAQYLKTIGALNDPALFRKELSVLLGQLKTPSDGNRLKGLYYKEMLEQLKKYPKENAVLLVHELLKAQDFYEQWDCNVGGLCDELERSIAEPSAMAHRDEIVRACSKAYNAAALLLSDHKNIRCASETAYAETYGRLRQRFRILDCGMRKKLGLDHLFCSCHYQGQRGESTTYAWPVISNKVVSLPARPSGKVEEGEQSFSALIATCGYGSGHKRLAGAVGSYLKGSGFDVNIMDIPSDVLKEQDIIHKLTSSWPMSKIFGKGCTITDFYNWLVRHNYWCIISFMKKAMALLSSVKMAMTGESSTESMTAEEDLIRRRILMERPDVLIGTYQIHEENLVHLAEEFKLPFLSVNPDLGLKRNWKTSPKYPHYRMITPVGFDNFEKSLGGTLKSEQVVIAGSGFVDPALLPVRSPEEIKLLKEKMGIDPRKKVVMLMNGGCGCPSRFPDVLAKRFAEEEGDIHLIVVCGNNESFQKHLVDKVQTNTQMTMDIRGWTEREALNDIYDVTNVIITKPGGLTNMEAGRKGVKILFDNTLQTGLPWENENMEITHSFGMGEICNQADEFYPLLRKLLDDDSNRVVKNPFAQNDPEKAIVDLTKKMIRDVRS